MKTESIGDRDPGLDLVKWIAVFSMIVDHVGRLWTWYHSYPFYYFGRLAIPLFCFALGFASITYTSNQARLMRRLWFWGLISQIPYSLYEGTVLTPNFMLILAFGMTVWFFALDVGSRLRIPSLGKWLYWFYPLHLFVLWCIRELLVS